MKRLKNKTRWLLIALLALPLIAVAGFFVWASAPLGPSPAAMEALSMGGTVDVTAFAEGWAFTPAVGSSEPTTGLVFYGGGRVDARSYAPFARELASLGHVVVISKAPLSLQVFDADAAAGIIADERFDGVEEWAVGGHSLGGAMAARFIEDEGPSKVSGLLLLGAYPPGGTRVPDTITVIDVTGSEDGVLDRDEWQAARARLPKTTTVIELAGANHAQFGDYGPQPGDNAAEMSAAEQRSRSVGAANQLLRSM